MPISSCILIYIPFVYLDAWTMLRCLRYSQSDEPLPYVSRPGLPLGSAHTTRLRAAVNALSLFNQGIGAAWDCSAAIIEIAAEQDGSAAIQGGKMPRGDKSKYTSKQKRQAQHIEEGYENRGVSRDEAEKRAWATVNKSSGGGKKSGSGRGRPTTKAPIKRGGHKGHPAKRRASR